MLTYLILRGDVVEVELVEKSVVDTPDDNCDADFHSAWSKFRVREDAEPQGFLRTLGHEVAHYFLSWGGLDKGLVAASHSGEAGKDLVEGVCDMFGAALIEVIRDNPHLVEEIRKVYAQKARGKTNDQ